MGDLESQARLRTAYAEALALIRSGRFASAERELRALRASSPDDLNSARLLGVALLAQDKIGPALQILESTVARAPDFWLARLDLARALRAAGRLEEARAFLRQVSEAAPGLDLVWLAYGDVLVDLEKYPDARVAYERARLTDPHRARIDEARSALNGEDFRSAENAFREILKEDASHVGALCGLAATSLEASRGADAVRLLHHALKQSAHCPLIWRGLCQSYVDLGKIQSAEAAARHLIAIEAENPQNWVMLGTVLSRMMRQADALPAFEEAARLNPGEIGLKLSMGHLYKTLGRRAESVAAYRGCLDVNPRFAEAYWSLADLKNYVFSDAEVEAMQALHEGEAGDDASQAQLNFALGRAFEHNKDYAAAFEHYAIGNRRRRKIVPFSIEEYEDKTRRVREFFNRAYFAERAGSGIDDPAPIFIVGLPRSGSTLVEQILASHSKIEGTFELPNILTMVRELDHATPERNAYPESLRAVPNDVLTALGRRYIEETSPLRSERRHFIDKMPNNFSHVGLIHSIMPRAVVIDVRRHPMDACFSTFKQHFAEGQSFSYGLEDLGRYYRCYLNLMDHWDEVLPGKVLHLRYEQLVREPESEIRALLAHCGVEFEETCLEFHANKRPVRTASAEQVRQPLYSSGVGYWRHFETELDPLREALGDCLARFED